MIANAWKKNLRNLSAEGEADMHMAWLLTGVILAAASLLGFIGAALAILHAISEWPREI